MKKRFHLKRLGIVLLRLLACVIGLLLLLICVAALVLKYTPFHEMPPKETIIENMKMCYLIREEDRTFDANEDIIIDFYCGTSIPKNDRQYSQFKQLKVYAREYSGYSSISEVNDSFIEDWESNDFYNSMILFSIDDFNAETYPIDVVSQGARNPELLGDENKISVTIPRELFTAEKGYVYIATNQKNETRCTVMLDYKYIGDKIYFEFNPTLTGEAYDYYEYHNIEEKSCIRRFFDSIWDFLNGPDTLN